jgi:redox-sensitive bicupin YhaK (pirin superfamily)
MINIQKHQNLGELKISWLHARYHFSFAHYYNPKRLGFGKLLVVNDDIVRAGKGFDRHYHENMEIVTYVRKGAITHKDSQGNEDKIVAGDLQVMSAGSGIYHSEYNLENEDAIMYQIWIEARSTGSKPSYNSKKFPNNFSKNKLPLLVSGREKTKEKALYINQDAQIYGGKIDKGEIITHHIKNQAYLLMSYGKATIEGNLMLAGDGCEISNVDNIKIEAKEESEILIIEISK